MSMDAVAVEACRPSATYKCWWIRLEVKVKYILFTIRTYGCTLVLERCTYVLGERKKFCGGFDAPLAFPACLVIFLMRLVEECKCAPISCGEIGRTMSVVSNSVLSQFWCVVVGALRRTVLFCRCFLCTKQSLSSYHRGLGVFALVFLFRCSHSSAVRYCEWRARLRYRAARRNKEKESMALTRGGVEAQWTSLCNLFKGNGANGL